MPKVSSSGFGPRSTASTHRSVLREVSNLVPGPPSEGRLARRKDLTGSRSQPAVVRSRSTTEREVRRAIAMIVIIGLTPGADGNTDASAM